MQSQDTDSKVNDTTQVAAKAFALGDISEETEKLGQRIIKLKKILQPSAQVKEVDSLLNSVSSEIEKSKDSLIPQLDKLTRRVLRVRKVEWDNYHSQLKVYQDILKNRVQDISKIIVELLKENQKWDETKKNIASSTNKSSDLTEGLNESIDILQEVMQIAQTRVDGVYLIQKELTIMILSVDETISEIELVERQLQKDYFIIDSSPLWKSQIKSDIAVDSIKTEPQSASTLILAGLKENKEQLAEFLSLNIKTMVFQWVFILLLFVLMLIVNKKWKKNRQELTNPIEIQAKTVLSNPVTATIVVGVLISAFFYEALIPAFSEFHIVFILIATVYLLPKLTNRRFRIFLALVFLVYLIHTFEAYLGAGTLVRWLILIDAIILIVALIQGRKTMIRSPEQFEPIFRLFKVLSSFYILFLVISIVANIVGMVSLSSLLVTGILMSTSLGMVVYLAVKVIASLVILFFKFRKSYNMQTLTTMISATHRRIQPILNWAGLLIWIFFTLNGFDLYELILNWFNELMIMHWEIGKMTISLGGILSFIGIFIVTLIIAKVAAGIFQDEWMVNVLPRGIAPAISLVLRIIVIGVGIYMASTAAGIDLSNLGFMFGALGVGIGFGLQNVVLNFVAGLILAFERPINLGDTIEVDQEFGIVTNIGVRSSNIKSYAGYEAIIPNGDLISKKVINYTLANRNRRSKIQMKTAPSADPEKVIELFNKMAAEDPRTHKDPAPKTYFYGYDPEGSLSFALYYWTTFSDTLKTDSAIALKIFAALKEEGIQAPAPVRRIIDDK